jgi:hypothetical protein
LSSRILIIYVNSRGRYRNKYSGLADKASDLFQKIESDLIFIVIREPFSGATQGATGLGVCGVFATPAGNLLFIRQVMAF